MFEFVVILPTLNERDNIIQLIRQILDLKIESLEIIVVDDSSEDHTAQLVLDVFPEHPMIRVIERTGKRSLADSLNEAILASDSENVIWMDADLQMSVDRIPVFIELMKDKSITAVIASRFISGGIDMRDNGILVTMVHRLLSKLLNSIVPYILGLEMTDITSGYIAIRKSFFASYKLQGSHGEYFIALSHELQQRKAVVKEIPFSLSPRLRGISKSTNSGFLFMFSMGLRYLQITLKTRFKR